MAPSADDLDVLSSALALDAILAAWAAAMVLWPAAAIAWAVCAAAAWGVVPATCRLCARPGWWFYERGRLRALVREHLDGPAPVAPSSASYGYGVWRMTGPVVSHYQEPGQVPR